MTFHQVQKLKLLNGRTYMYTRYVFHIVLDNFHFSMLTTFTFINWHLSLHMPIAFPFRLDNFHFKILTTFTLRPDNFHFKTLTTFTFRPDNFHFQTWQFSFSDLTPVTLWLWLWDLPEPCGIWSSNISTSHSSRSQPLKVTYHWMMGLASCLAGRQSHPPYISYV